MRPATEAASHLCCLFQYAVAKLFIRDGAAQTKGKLLC